MTYTVSLEAIADRLQSFLDHQSAAGEADPGRRLGIDGATLDALLRRRQALDVHGLVDLVAAVIEHYGVDLQWLLTGEYGVAAHRTLEDDGPPTRDALRATLAGMLARGGDAPGREGWRSLGA